MPDTARKYYNSKQYYADIETLYPRYSGNYTEVKQSYYTRTQNAPTQKPDILRVNKRKVNRNNILHKVISLIFFGLIAYFILPLGFHRVTMSFIGGSPYKNIKTNNYELRFPTANYLSNDLLFNQRFYTNPETKKPLMQTFATTNEMQGLKNDLNYLISLYPSIRPSVFVWQYDTENYVDINGDEVYSAASIIKIPVLIQLFRAVEQNQISLDEKMTLTDVYRAEGSGSLQYKAENSQWTIDKLARLMITESDNSATNMIMSKLGSMTDVNSAIRQWGLSKTYIQTWLPDMTGTNHTTAKDMATMLYNIDSNTKFLNMNSREKIFDYMGHVHNNRLIQAGLGPGASFMHKTGDIGKMLGDAGIVYTANDKKYIVVILANRPHNSTLGKEFIVKASETIYNYMTK